MLDEWLRRQQSGGIAAELKEQRDEVARALAAHERGLKRLVDAYEIGAIEVDDLKTRSDAARARIERARHELTNAEWRLRETTTLRAVITRLDDFSTHVCAGLARADAKALVTSTRARTSGRSAPFCTSSCGAPGVPRRDTQRRTP
jgi:site-specific DNA recombinase